MGGIVAAAVVAHVPPLMVPAEFRRMLSPAVDTTLIDGLKSMRRELEAAKVDTFIIFDTHWVTTTEHIVAGAPHHKGTFTSEELPQLMADMPYDYKGAPDLGELVQSVGAEIGVRTLNTTNPHVAKHYPTLNLLHYLLSDQAVLAAGTCQTAQVHNFLQFGAVIAEAAKRSNRKVALLASGGMSHKFWPFDVIFQHGSFSADHIVSPEARAFDEKIINLWEKGDHASVIDAHDAYLAYAPEGMFGHYLSMVGALGGRDCRLKGRRLSAYENALGTGQVHVWFDIPEGQL
jgi:3,4-dihydroxyphenylacetate 2,3-dioxygenase